MNILDELVMFVGGGILSIREAEKILVAQRARPIDRKSPGALFGFICASAPCFLGEIDTVLVTDSDLARGQSAGTLMQFIRAGPSRGRA